jgi:hypothetical protein
MQLKKDFQIKSKNITCFLIISRQDSKIAHVKCVDQTVTGALQLDAAKLNFEHGARVTVHRLVIH